MLGNKDKLFTFVFYGKQNLFERFYILKEI